VRRTALKNEKGVAICWAYGSVKPFEPLVGCGIALRKRGCKKSLCGPSGLSGVRCYAWKYPKATRPWHPCPNGNCAKRNAFRSALAKCYDM